MKVKIYLLIATLLITTSLTGCQGQSSASFKDPHLEQVIRQTLGRPHGSLSSGDLLGITDLDARDRDIRNLEGIEALANLRSLRLDNNRLVDISPLARLARLETLTLRGNEISDLSSLTGLTSLQKLDLRDNSVADASPLANLTNLMDLNLRGNRIEDIAFLSKLTRLRVLNLRENQISDITVLAKLTLLEDLNLRHNRITDVSPLADLVNLTVRLYLEGNPVSNFRPLRYVLEKVADIDIPFAISDPDFSVMGGFYEKPFELKLSTYRPRGVIWYTLDGSEPDPVNNKANTFQYKGPLSIDSRSGEPNRLSVIKTTHHFWQGPPKGEVFKATVVRARVFVDGQPCGDIETQTYFVDPEIKTRYSMPVISLATDPAGLFDDKIGIYVPGERYVEGNRRTGNYWASGPKWEREAHMEFYESDGKFGFAQGVGIRIHGGITRDWPQKSLRVYARREYGSDKINYDLFPGHYDHPISFERVLLRNGGNDMRLAFMRDALVHRLVQHTGLDTQAWRPAIVFINGEYWGIHNLRERIDQHYLNGKYGVEKEQVVILEGNATLVQGPTTGPRHYKDMLDFVRNNSMAEESNYRHVQTLMDTDNYIDYMITKIWAADTDWPHNNIRYWRVQAPEDQLADIPGHDGRWRWLLYDLDYGLGLAEEPSHNSLSRVVNSEDWATVLITRLLKNPEFRTDFINRFADHLNYTFDPQRVNQVIDEMVAIYQPEMEEHLQRWPYISSVRQWERNVDNIRNWVSVRPRYLRGYLINQFKLAGPAKLTLSAQGGQGRIMINSLSFTAQDMPWTGIYFQGVPVSVEAVPDEGYVFVGWQGAITDSQPQQSLNLTGDTSLVAVFAPAQ